MTLLTANIAHTTAFLYAGALTPDQETDKFDAWEGHASFVQTCTDYAEAIETWLVADGPQNHPGVYAYEVIEPLGAWLIGHDGPLPLDTATVLQEFQRRYLEWIKDTDEHGIKPTDRVVAHDGNVIQEGVKARIITTENYTIELDLHGKRERGYFEHNLWGDERAGGLWYDENKDLFGYDGVFELPKEVREALIADGFTSTEGCFED